MGSIKAVYDGMRMLDMFILQRPFASGMNTASYVDHHQSRSRYVRGREGAESKTGNKVTKVGKATFHNKEYECSNITLLCNNICTGIWHIMIKEKCLE